MKGNNDQRIEPEDASEQTALSRCLVDGDASAKARDRRRRQEALGISLIIESLVLAALIVAPLMTSVAQPQPTHLIPPMPIVMGSWTNHNASRSNVLRPIHHGLDFPVSDFHPRLPSTIENPQQIAEPDGDPGLNNLGGYVPGAISMNDFRPTSSQVEPPPVETHKMNEKSIVKVSEGVQRAQLVTRIEPRYPPLAIATRTQGTVLLHAIISVDGRITRLEVVSGPPLLVQAAIDAVREWRYRPTYLSGQAVEVETSISVIFRLGQ
jgi:protein TonB